MRHKQAVDYFRALTADYIGTLAQKLSVTPEEICVETTTRDNPLAYGGKVVVAAKGVRFYAGEFSLLATNHQMALLFNGRCMRSGLGIGQLMLRLRLEALKRAGVISVITTVRKDNEVMRHILSKMNFRVVLDATPTADLWSLRLLEENNAA